MRLLAELGYAMTLTHEPEGRPIDASSRYHYAFDRGPQPYAAEPAMRYPVVRGATLLALAGQREADSEIAAEARRLMRDVLDHHLESRRIESRRIAAELQEIQEIGDRK